MTLDLPVPAIPSTWILSVYYRYFGSEKLSITAWKISLYSIFSVNRSPASSSVAGGAKTERPIFVKRIISVLVAAISIV